MADKKKHKLTDVILELIRPVVSKRHLKNGTVPHNQNGSDHTKRKEVK